MTTGGQSVLGAKVRVPRIKALARERLDERLASVWDHRLGLVIAPAGSGKTTLLAQFAADAGVPVAWYRAEPADASAEAAVAHLERGLTAALGITGGWKDIDDVIEALDGWDGDRALLAVDDLHALWGTEAEATLERLLSHVPPGIVMVAATRRAPGFNLSRLRVSGDLFEIGPEDLRFRSWEVERLFLEFYGEPLRPDELAELARRTEGWAAGLQLFHLATRASRLSSGGASCTSSACVLGSCASTSPATCSTSCRCTCATSCCRRACSAGSPRRCATSCAVRRRPMRCWPSSSSARSSPLPSTTKARTATTRSCGRTWRRRWWSRWGRPRRDAATRRPVCCWSGTATCPRRCGPTAGGGLAGGDEPPRGTGRAGHRPSGSVARGAAADVARPRSLAAAGVGPSGRGGGTVGGRARRVPAGRGGVGSRAAGRDQPS